MSPRISTSAKPPRENVADAPEAPSASWGESAASQLVQRFVEAWEQGERPTAEHFLAAHASSAADPELAVRLIYEEMCLRRETGCEVPSQEILRRFPQWRSELELLIDCQRLLAPDAIASFPNVGDELGQFRLLAELGRGAMGRVYLATQPALSDRPVVLKCTPETDQEHLSLARLQHTGIVPLYLAQSVPERNVRLLCMPYLGGVTLARLLEELAAIPLERRSGADIAARIEADARRISAAAVHSSPALKFLRRATYWQAVCWIGACLADALHYAHQRGLNHFDVKPSNVLLASDGQPMLLDFHLAREGLAAGSHETWLGGTPGYMSPEQQAAMAKLREGAPITDPVDHRSDIYSLGVVLEEMLFGKAGRRPTATPPSSTGSRRTESHASRLAAIIRKCMAAAPQERYQDASLVVDELRALMIAKVRSSRLRDWAQRHAQVGFVLLASACAVACSAAFFSWTHLRRSEAKLAAAQQELDDQALVERHERLARRVRGVVDRLRWLSRRESLDRRTAQSLDAMCHAMWEYRAPVLRAAPAQNSTPHVSPREDLLDLAILWADLQVFLALPGDQSDAHVKAADLLDGVLREFGANPVVAYERRRHRRAASGGSSGVEGGAEATLPSVRNSWEHYALGRSLLLRGDAEDAHAILSRGAAADPRCFWLQFALGECCEELGRLEEAAAAYSACIALAPKTAESYQRRSEVYAKGGLWELARRDQEQARQWELPSSER